MIRTGKIARLPRPIREDLSRRLEGNQPGRQIVTWLNSLPEVQKVLQNLFRGKPVSEQNLSEWRSGGYAEWQARREFIEDAREKAHHAADLEESAVLMADHAAGLLAIRYSDAISQWNGDPDDPAFASLKHLSALIRDVAILSRRSERATRLKMDQCAFDAACQERRGILKEEDTRFASTRYVQKWARRFGPADPHHDPKQDPQRILDGLDKMTRQWLREQGKKPETPLCAYVSGNSLSPEDSDLIKPHQTNKSDFDEEKTTPKNAPLPEPLPPPPAPAPASPIHASPIHASPIHASPIHASPIHASPIHASPTHASPIPPPTPASDADLWQMRSRDLPSDPSPDWRVQLPIKTQLPSWMTPFSYKTLSHPTKARMPY